MSAIRLLDTQTIIAKKVAKALAVELNNRLSSAIQSIKTDVKYLTGEYLRNDPAGVYHDLQYGELRGHMGLPAEKASEIVDNVVSAVVDNKKVELEPVSPGSTFKSFRGGLRIGVLASNLSDILSVSDASIQIITRGGEPFSLDWLEWMLTRENDIIIDDFRFKPNQYGRSERGIMVPKGSWSVPDYAAGSPENNWLTRAITDKQRTYIKELTSIIKRNIS